MLSIIITAYKEGRSIGAVLESLFNSEYQNTPNMDYEVILACPDDETENAAREKLTELNFDFTKFVRVKDPQKGKPTALNMAFEIAKGDILILTDGDVVKIAKNSVNSLITALQRDKMIGGVTARPMSADRKINVFGYWGNLLSDAANDKRLKDMKSNLAQNKFFVMSGYLMCIYKPNFKLPAEVLADDAYISYKIKESGKAIVYEPLAQVYIKYPTNLSDWYKQKSRSLGGYIQLHQMGVLNHENRTRNFTSELEYFKFPFQYATSLHELWWSLLLYPVRLFLWIRIFVERKILRKSFSRTWVRIESTK